MAVRWSVQVTLVMQQSQDTPVRALITAMNPLLKADSLGIA